VRSPSGNPVADPFEVTIDGHQHADGRVEREVTLQILTDDGMSSDVAARSGKR
jgi:hypothetical protein